MCLLDMLTSYSTSNKSKTIFEDIYGFTPDVESLPVVGRFACRLEEVKTRTDKKLGLRNSVGTFVGFATYWNVHGAVILTGKDTHIVGTAAIIHHYAEYLLLIQHDLRSGVSFSFYNTENQRRVSSGELSDARKLQ